MPTTRSIVPDHRNCSQGIKDKAQRLDILMLTPFIALVDGDHDTYMVWRETLACSCPAGEVGKYCSHAEAVRLATTPPPQTPRRYARYNATTGLLDVLVGATVVGQVKTYLQLEATNANL